MDFSVSRFSSPKTRRRGFDRLALQLFRLRGVALLVQDPAQIVQCDAAFPDSPVPERGAGCRRSAARSDCARGKSPSPLYTSPMTYIICAWSSGSWASPVSISFDALSRISRAVTLLPRASLGSETLNIPSMNSVMRFARSRSRVMRRNWNDCITANPASSSTKPCGHGHARADDANIFPAAIDRHWRDAPTPVRAKDVCQCQRKTRTRSRTGGLDLSPAPSS